MKWSLKQIFLFALWVLNGCCLTQGVPLPTVFQTDRFKDSQDLIDRIGSTRSQLAPLQLTSERETAVYHAGDSMQFGLVSSKPLHVACFYQRTDGSIVKVFPNRFHTKSLLQPGHKKVFPNQLFFSMRAGESGKNEALLCLASPEVLQDQPAWVEQDFVPLHVGTLEEVIARYKAHGGDELSIQKLKIEVH